VYAWRLPSQASAAELVACLEARERWALTAHHACAWVVDLREILRVPPDQRKLFAEHLKRFESHDVRYNQGSALVMSNAWLRGVVASIFALFPPKFPHRTFPTPESALSWAQQQIHLAA